MTTSTFMSQTATFHFLGGNFSLNTLFTKLCEHVCVSRLTIETFSSVTSTKLGRIHFYHKFMDVP